MIQKLNLLKMWVKSGYVSLAAVKIHHIEEIIIVQSRITMLFSSQVKALGILFLEWVEFSVW